MHNLHILGPRDPTPSDGVIVNTTSRSKDFGRAFSPMINQGPIELAGLCSHNVENMWQATKCYKEYVEKPQEWLAWRNKLLADRFAHRYPMGKGKKPEFSYLSKEYGKLSYTQARKVIYIPAYQQKLERYCTRQVHSIIDMLTVSNIYLWDFDGRVTEESFDEIVNNQDAKCGHAFVLKKHVYNIIGKDF